MQPSHFAARRIHYRSHSLDCNPLSCCHRFWPFPEPALTTSFVTSPCPLPYFAPSSALSALDRSQLFCFHSDTANLQRLLRQTLMPSKIRNTRMRPSRPSCAILTVVLEPLRLSIPPKLPQACLRYVGFLLSTRRWNRSTSPRGL